MKGTDRDLRTRCYSAMFEIRKREEDSKEHSMNIDVRPRMMIWRTGVYFTGEKNSGRRRRTFSLLSFQNSQSLHFVKWKNFGHFWQQGSKKSKSSDLSHLFLSVKEGSSISQIRFFHRILIRFFLSLVSQSWKKEAEEEEGRETKLQESVNDWNPRHLKMGSENRQKISSSPLLSSWITVTVESGDGIAVVSLSFSFV